MAGIGRSGVGKRWRGDEGASTRINLNRAPIVRVSYVCVALTYLSDNHLSLVLSSTQRHVHNKFAKSEQPICRAGSVCVCVCVYLTRGARRSPCYWLQCRPAAYRVHWSAPAPDPTQCSDKHIHLNAQYSHACTVTAGARTLLACINFNSFRRSCLT